jgi:hypothetical protein
VPGHFPASSPAGICISGKESLAVLAARALVASLKAPDLDVEAGAAHCKELAR